MAPSTNLPVQTYIRAGAIDREQVKIQNSVFENNVNVESFHVIGCGQSFAS